MSPLTQPVATGGGGGKGAVTAEAPPPRGERVGVAADPDVVVLRDEQGSLGPEGHQHLKSLCLCAVVIDIVVIDVVPPAAAAFSPPLAPFPSPSYSPSASPS